MRVRIERRDTSRFVSVGVFGVGVVQSEACSAAAEEISGRGCLELPISFRA